MLGLVLVLLLGLRLEPASAWDLTYLRKETY